MNRLNLVEKSAAVLLVSPFEEDHSRLGHILREPKWRLLGVRACLDVWTLLREQLPPVVICERDLPDGNWKDVLEAVTLLSPSSSLIVTCRLADEYLWGEVLNLGGHDVLAKPLDEREVLWALDSACRGWNRRNGTTGYMGCASGTRRSKSSLHSELRSRMVQ
jgi:DNA-binding response OmpR family regulator